MLTLLMTLLITGDIPAYRISKINKVLEGYEDRLLDRPLAMELRDDNFYVFDNSYQLWSLDKEGNILHAFGSRTDIRTLRSKGLGPGEFGESFENLYFLGNDLLVLHTSGTRYETFAPDGNLTQSKRIPFSGLYIDGKVEVRSSPTKLDSKGRGIFPERLGIQIFVGKEPQEYLLQDPKYEDIGGRVHNFVKKQGKYLFISTTNGIQKTIHYLVYDLEQMKVIDQNAVRLMDKRIGGAQKIVARNDNPGNRTVPIMVGCTTSKTLGFVITEHTIPEKYRVIRTYDPTTQKWGALKILFENSFDDMFFFQHLSDDRWAAYADDALVFFEIAPAH